MGAWGAGQLGMRPFAVCWLARGVCSGQSNQLWARKARKVAQSGRRGGLPSQPNQPARNRTQQAAAVSYVPHLNHIVVLLLLQHNAAQRAVSQVAPPCVACRAWRARGGSQGARGWDIRRSQNSDCLSTSRADSLFAASHGACTSSQTSHSMNQSSTHPSRSLPAGWAPAPVAAPCQSHRSRGRAARGGRRGASGLQGKLGQ